MPVQEKLSLSGLGSGWGRRVSLSQSLAYDGISVLKEAESRDFSSSYDHVSLYWEDGYLQAWKKAPTRNVLFCGSQLPHMRTLPSPEERLTRSRTKPSYPQPAPIYQPCAWDTPSLVKLLDDCSPANIWLQPQKRPWLPTPESLI